jgi:2-polyprenyl-3-methyl-5-hydroxy-6-metoxy-1,4-benzoquinol methylase
MSAAIDKANEEFWNELCGSSLARQLGIAEHSRESLEIYDRTYLEFYPYLLYHVRTSEMRGKRVMEVGLGYGTLGQKIAEAGAEYLGLDIASQPVRTMKHRLRIVGLPGEAAQGNILDCPIDSESLDWVVSIGCFHHTGDVQRCIDETYRVLKPGGGSTIMVYNRFSLRQWVWWPWNTLQAGLADAGLRTHYPATSEKMRRFYDSSASGAPAPETQFSSIKELRKMFKKYSHAEFHKENCDGLIVPKLHLTAIPRQRLLSSVGRKLGTDIYVEAQK